LKSASNAEFVATLAALQQAFEGLKPLTPLLPDGSMDFPKAVASSNIDQAMSLLVDGNDDTFPGYYLTPDSYYEFDFGPDFKFSATAFAMEGRVNFENRMENVKFYGSNDGRTWTELTPDATRTATELTKIPVADKLTSATFRFLRARKGGGGLESSELRIFGSRHETGNKLESVSLSADKQSGLRVALGGTARLTITTREPISNVRVRIQGIDATVRQTNANTTVAEAVLRPGQAKTGPVEFSIDYRRKDGTPADTTYTTTDGSRLLVVDESKLIRNVPHIAKILDPETGAVSANSQHILDVLFDNNPRTFPELSVKGVGAGVPLTFDFGPAKRVQLSGVELLARPDYRDRTAGAIVQGSDDGKDWTTLSEEAAPTEDWQNLKMKPSGKSYRYIRLFNRNNWLCNVSEVRFHGDVR
jgi:hypothetical protein